MIKIIISSTQKEIELTLAEFEELRSMLQDEPVPYNDGYSPYQFDPNLEKVDENDI